MGQLDLLGEWMVSKAFDFICLIVALSAMLACLFWAVSELDRMNPCGYHVITASSDVGEEYLLVNLWDEKYERNKMQNRRETVTVSTLPRR